MAIFSRAVPLRGCGAFHKIPEVSGRIINRSGFDLKYFRIEGESSFTRIVTIFFYGSKYLGYGEKSFHHSIKSDGRYRVRPRRVLTIHSDASFEYDIDLVLRNPEQIQASGGYAAIGSQFWGLVKDVSEDNLKGQNDYILIRKDLIVDMGQSFVESIQDSLPEKVKPAYGSRMELVVRVLHSDPLENSGKKASCISCYLPFSLSRDMSGPQRLCILALVPTRYSSACVEITLKGSLRNTMGGSGDFILWEQKQTVAVDDFHEEWLCPVSSGEVLQAITKQIEQRLLLVSFSDAVSEGDAESIENLIKQGVSVNALDDVGFPFLYRALQGNSMEIVRFLMKKGVDLNQLTSQGSTPLSGAFPLFHFYSDNPEKKKAAFTLIFDMISAGARDGAMLTQAVRIGDISLLKNILSLASGQAKKEDGRKALEAAAKAGLSDMVEILEKHGAQPTADN